MGTDQQQIEVQQEFSAPVDKVYAAWTEEAQLKQWWKPVNNQLQQVVNELKDGGTVDYRFEGEHLHISGQYKKVQPNELLEYTWNWEFPADPIKNADFTLTVKFEPAGEGSKLHVTQQSVNNHEALLPHQGGWEEGLKALKEFVEKK